MSFSARGRADATAARRVERDGLEHMFTGIFDQILAFASGKPINVANPEALKR